MVIKSWNLDQEQFESQLHKSYNACLAKLLEDKVIDVEQHDEAYRYAPRIVMPETLVGWLKKKLFPEEQTAFGKFICVKLYNEYEEDEVENDNEIKLEVLEKDDSRSNHDN